MPIPKIYIDGEAGTTGLEIRKRLEGRTDIEIISIAADKRKDADERKRLLNAADIAILCLPDDAAREAVAMVDNPRTKILDASTAFRTDPDWVYGFPELTAGQEAHIAKAMRVSNPGCYPTGALALIRPLADSELLTPDYAITINAISGYSGGGKELIALCESTETKGQGRGGPFCLYGLDQKHKHLPEIKKHGKLAQEPIFLPSYSNAFYRGMLVHIALRLNGLKRLTGTNVTPQVVQSVYEEHYKGQKHIRLMPLVTEMEKGFVLTPLNCNETNDLQIQLFANEEKDTIILTACLDNLGKGASGAAVQNLGIMLGQEG